uniref:Uncharacterized protein n=1 Tax=Cucumis melo TaxID=3656 RepID=A0A9I9EBC8_CUCME
MIKTRAPRNLYQERFRPHENHRGFMMQEWSPQVKEKTNLRETMTRLERTMEDTNFTKKIPNTK